MPTPSADFQPSQEKFCPPRPSDPAIREIRSAWRILTGGAAVRDSDRRTLIACSGGADSTALAIALAGVSPKPLLAHILHDLRPSHAAEADRDSTRNLADALGLEFAQATVAVRDSTQNLESAARTARYSALAQLATDRGIRWIATGHHADDQFETLLMRLIRGTGPEGLIGIHPSRPMDGCTVVRPMLSTTRKQAQDLCVQCGVAWIEDETNRDESRLRAAIRATVMPEIERIAPGAASRVANAADLQRQLIEVLDAQVESLKTRAQKETTSSPFTLDRAELTDASRVVVAALIRRLAGQHGQDRRGKQTLDAVVDAVTDTVPKRRVFELGGATVCIQKGTVEITPADPINPEDR